MLPTLNSDVTVWTHKCVIQYNMLSRVGVSTFVT